MAEKKCFQCEHRDEKSKMRKGDELLDQGFKDRREFWEHDSEIGNAKCDLIKEMKEEEVQKGPNNNNIGLECGAKNLVSDSNVCSSSRKNRSEECDKMENYCDASEVNRSDPFK